jgi:protein-S-isoprenylcysteine O-methyltransferase Ste14
MILGHLAVALAWAATRQLGKQWRYEAALSENHELITKGPYRWVRHPIYVSLLAMLLAVGTAWTWWPMFIASVVFYLLGTEVRVRAEDGLLAARFGEEFEQYKRATPAYLPFLR